MKDEQTRYKHSMPESCMTGMQAAGGMQSIVVRQVLGEKEKQKVLDIHVHVPERKPAIEQIIDVFVKNVEVNAVDVIMDRVIVRGEFEIKAIYVACLPGNPVHAVEIKRCKWTQDIDICGARPGMDADANVMVEFVDYDVAEMTRAYKYKYHGKYDPCDSTSDSHGGCHLSPCENPCNMNPCGVDSCAMDSFSPADTMECCPPHKPMPPFKPPIAPPVAPPVAPPCDMMPPENQMPVCPPPVSPIAPPCPPVSCEEICCRDFDVSVILKITAKVMADREVQMNSKPAGKPLPARPKG